MLDTVDLTLTLDRKSYRRQLLRHQLALRRLAFRMYEKKRSLVIVYEGWDAAGKGGNIRRLTEKLDPRGYSIVTISAPRGEERTHHYLWRFWRRLLPPDEKQIVVFDRSWYGRVMVERVEGFAEPDQWRRAYREINEFERQLTDAGIMLAKFWLHIGKDEQLRRFEARKQQPHKAFKLTDEDWRNRDKWDAYRDAVQEMLIKTSTLSAPWTVVEANCKRYARVKALRALVDVVSAGLGDASPAGEDNAATGPAEGPAAAAGEQPEAR